MPLQVRINGPAGQDTIVTLCENEQQMKKMTVTKLRRIITERIEITDDFQLNFRTEKMEDSYKLETYGIKHMSTIHLVLRLDGGI